MRVYLKLTRPEAHDPEIQQTLTKQLNLEMDVDSQVDRVIDHEDGWSSIVWTASCDCRCHSCCVPMDESCDDCRTNHGAPDVRLKLEDGAFATD